MDKKEIIMTYVYKSESLKKYFSARVDRNYIDDVKSQLYISLLEMKEEKLFKAYDDGYLDALCIRIIKNQYNSDESYFFKEIKNSGFRKTTEKVDSYDETDYDEIVDYDDLIQEDIKIEENLIQINKILSSLHWYDKTLFDMFVVDGIKAHKISKMTNINTHSIRYSIRKTFNKIREELKK